VKCPGCGTENPDQASLCRLCKRPLTRQVGVFDKERFSTPKSAVRQMIDQRTVADRVKFEYTHGVKDNTQKTLEGVQNLLSRFQDSQMDIDKVLNEAADYIWRQFGIDNVAIGLRDPKDGKYRYRAMVGFRPDALEAHKKIAYRKEEFLEDGEYHGITISKYTRMYLAENNIPAEGLERGAYNRPGLLAMKRMDSTDSLEGDYIDIGIYGRGDELVGWIEISGTRTMKLPDVTTIRWVEVIASIIAVALLCSSSH
jgi:hypothetical protein